MRMKKIKPGEYYFYVTPKGADRPTDMQPVERTERAPEFSRNVAVASPDSTYHKGRITYGILSRRENPDLPLIDWLPGYCRDLIEVSDRGKYIVLRELKTKKKKVYKNLDGKVNKVEVKWGGEPLRILIKQPRDEPVIEGIKLPDGKRYAIEFMNFLYEHPNARKHRQKIFSFVSRDYLPTLTRNGRNYARLWKMIGRGSGD